MSDKFVTFLEAVADALLDSRDMDRRHDNHQMHGGHPHHHGHGHHDHDDMVGPTAHGDYLYEDDDGVVAEPEHVSTHGHHGGDGGHGGHAMFFHGGVAEVVLFDFWRINTVGGLIGSMVGLFFLAVAYEGLKALRDYLYSREWESKEQSDEDRAKHGRWAHKKRL